jgi:hypothetical protein
VRELLAGTLDQVARKVAFQPALPDLLQLDGAKQ